MDINEINYVTNEKPEKYLTRMTDNTLFWVKCKENGLNKQLEYGCIDGNGERVGIGKWETAPVFDSLTSPLTNIFCFR